VEDKRGRGLTVIAKNLKRLKDVFFLGESHAFTYKAKIRWKENYFS